MKYVIEGVISNIRISKRNDFQFNVKERKSNLFTVVSHNENRIFFYLNGSEGYALKYNKKKYNILCPKKLAKKNKILKSFIVDTKVSFAISTDYENLILQAATNGKKIKLEVDGQIIDSFEKKHEIKVDSIMLLLE